ncbi:Asp23/Gls24 family envelope stress response protein [Vagococcus entomophilus]|uniref:Stress response regulator gls24 homolog n=1 Tax=Vagococcus entomophilus TaxID=1160095 RepID=A0A430AHB1_9ENTE|nr:Asp23/Gls24 family envelope stress response protein [Vagococcus entomophilus]RSU07167.1 Asp23/Gls24 family envelope stress response protein [Vagococcus entomophilus]
MVETNKQVQNTEIKGELTFEDKVVQKIVGIALEKVEGLLTVDGGFFSNLTQKLVDTDDVTKGVDVEVGKKQVAVDLNVVVEYGRNIPELFDSIRKVIKENVKKMTGLEVVEVNVNVIDVKSKQQHEEDSVSLQEKTSEVLDNSADKVKSTYNSTKKEAKKKLDENRVQ